jgi:hypothetical protein
VAAPDGVVRTLRVHVPAARGRIKAGLPITLSHPPGQPEALHPGTPTPLLVGAVAGGLMALLGLSILLGG